MSLEVEIKSLKRNIYSLEEQVTLLTLKNANLEKSLDKETSLRVKLQCQLEAQSKTLANAQAVIDAMKKMNEKTLEERNSVNEIRTLGIDKIKRTRGNYDFSTNGGVDCCKRWIYDACMRQ